MDDAQGQLPSMIDRLVGAARRELSVAAALMIAMILGVTACAGVNSSSGGSSASGAEIMTITHQYGKTQIQGIPQRPVTIGAAWTDALVTLDVSIVGEFVSSAHSKATGYPWTPAHESKTFRYETGSLPSFEQVAALKPDVIFFGALSDENAYEQFSKIAPVVPVMTPGAAVDSWQNVTKTAGKIFDKRQEANKAVENVETLLADTKKKFPATRGKTFAYGQLTPTKELGVVTSPSSPSAKLLSDIGLTLSPSVQKLSPAGERTVVSPERIDVLNSDVLVFWPMTGRKDAFDSIAGWNDLTAVRNDTIMYLNNDTAAAFVTPTVYSVPWAVGKLTPVLEKLK